MRHEISVTLFVESADDRNALQSRIDNDITLFDLLETAEVGQVVVVDPATNGVPYFCHGCGREEGVCSADPCPGVIADREATI